MKDSFRISRFAAQHDLIKKGDMTLEAWPFLPIRCFSFGEINDEI
jgi:hypothetical protein